ncbi:luc7-like protein 3 isoform X2 [Euwallacea similis]|uniref:luc7-like protein 3 isoform X2 n=1 Tax=Euwallacea similis TaxID=1736056 RepID=UPI0034505FC5
MAVLAAAQLLDELMGRHRNIAPNENFRSTDWEDPEYCKFFMVKFCPHDLFVNTRADLGPCSKTHDEEARKLFQEAKKAHFRKIQYQEDFIRFCTSMLTEVERKIVKGKQRLALSGKSVLASTNPQQAEKNQEKIDILNERINDLEREAEEAGTDGNVEQAQGLMKLCDQLKEEREALRKSEIGQLNLTAQLAVEQEKQMEVCEVCGAFLIVGDAQQRIDDHLMGKQHMGYMRLKKAVEEITAIIMESKEPRKFVREKDGDRMRRRERDVERTRDKERERSRSGQREIKNRDEERERDHERGRDFETRDTKHRERDRDHERRHRSDREDRHRHHHHHHHSHRHRR